MNTVIQPTEDLPFCIVVVEATSHFFEFQCYECPAVGAYRVANYTLGTEWTQDLAKAQVYLSGSIKWDGCANLHFDEQDNVMLHFCGKSHAQKIGKLIERLYQLAADVIPFWDGGE